MAAEIWIPPADGPSIPWEAVVQSLRIPQTWPSPHLLHPWKPKSPRRAAVAVVLWGDPEGARKLVLVQRGFQAPHHPGELAFPGGMEDPRDRDLPTTARRELQEELGIQSELWELGTFPDGVAKGRTRFTPVFFRWEAPPILLPGSEIDQGFLLPILPLMNAPWKEETLLLPGRPPICAPRLELAQAPLWGATAFILKAWLEVLGKCRNAFSERG